MKKNPLKSKTIDSVLVVILIAVMSILGIGEKEIVQTYDGLGESRKADVPVKELATLGAAGMAIYGRYKVKNDDE